MQSDPVNAATQILLSADGVGALQEIDWTENPADDVERELRAVMLRVIEQRARNIWRGHELIGAIHWKWALKSLTDRDAEFLGDDLFDELERARATVEAETLNDKQRTKDELLRASIAEMNRQRYSARRNEIFKEFATKHPRMGVIKALKMIDAQMRAEGFDVSERRRG